MRLSSIVLYSIYFINSTLLFSADFKVSLEMPQEYIHNIQNLIQDTLNAYALTYKTPLYLILPPPSNEIHVQYLHCAFGLIHEKLSRLVSTKEPFYLPFHEGTIICRSDIDSEQTYYLASQDSLEERDNTVYILSLCLIISNPHKFISLLKNDLYEITYKSGIPCDNYLKVPIGKITYTQQNDGARLVKLLSNMRLQPLQEKHCIEHIVLSHVEGINKTTRLWMYKLGNKKSSTLELPV